VFNGLRAKLPISHEGGELEDPANGAPDGIWMLTSSPAQAPDAPGEVTVGFEKGVPVSVDGRRMSGTEIVSSLNAIGSRHAIGRIDLVVKAMRLPGDNSTLEHFLTVQVTEAIE
jgi:argininosuccinate synthase